MTPLEIIAFVLIAIGLLKLFFIFASPKTWHKGVVKPVYAHAQAARYVAFILGAIILFYLLKEISIVQIFAVMAFLTMFMLFEFALIPDDTLYFADRIYRKKNIIIRFWAPIAVWLALSLWALWEIFT